MAINGRRNKPIGPGGSTRRLHHRASVVRYQWSGSSRYDTPDRRYGGETGSTRA